MKAWQREIKELLKEAALATSNARSVVSSENEYDQSLETIVEMIDRLTLPD